jgi:sugar phosphate isomerase/epimerase
MDIFNLSQGQRREMKEHARQLELDLEVGIRGSGTRTLREGLSLATALDASLLRVILCPAGSSREIVESALSEIEVMLDGFRKGGVSISIENYESYNTEDLKWLIERVDDSIVSACLDPVNSFGAMERPDEVLTNLAEHTSCFHAKEFRITRPDHTMGILVEGAPMGEGELRLGDSLERINRVRPECSVILEQWVPPERELFGTIEKEVEWARKGFAYLVEAVEAVEGIGS